MCIDYLDLNKAISKKPFPLPQIDQVVDTVAGHVVSVFKMLIRDTIGSKWLLKTLTKLHSSPMIASFTTLECPLGEKILEPSSRRW